MSMTRTLLACGKNVVGHSCGARLMTVALCVCSAVLCAVNKAELEVVDVGLDEDVTAVTASAPHVTVTHAKVGPTCPVCIHSSAGSPLQYFAIIFVCTAALLTCLLYATVAQLKLNHFLLHQPAVQVRRGSMDMTVGPAMSTEEVHAAMRVGREAVQRALEDQDGGGTRPGKGQARVALCIGEASPSTGDGQFVDCWTHQSGMANQSTNMRCSG